MNSDSQKLLIVTGLAGAGMSSALKILEDLGYEAFDNFPLTLAEALITDPAAAGQPMAIGIDARTRGFDVAAIKALAKKHGGKLVFLTCDESMLRRRFTETRRRHPLAKDRPVGAGIAMEQQMLSPLQAAAGLVIDTTRLSVHDLRRLLEGQLSPDGPGHLSVSLVSFGFRFGLPRESDLVFDVRFLKNPYWQEALRPLTGLDSKVGSYIEEDDGFEPFFEKLKDIISFLLPRYALEGKSYLTVAIGCTGGHHRSVHTIEKLKTWVGNQNYPVSVLHRDIER